MNEMVANSDFIVWGRVTSARTFFDPATRAIWTETKVQVLESAKGRSGGTIAITEPGGILNGHGEVYPGTPQFRNDAELVLFLYRAPLNRNRVVGALQGMLPVLRDPVTGQRKVFGESRPRRTGLNVSSAVPAEAAAAMPLMEFLKSIRQQAATR